MSVPLRTIKTAWGYDFVACVSVAATNDITDIAVSRAAVYDTTPKGALDPNLSASVLLEIWHMLALPHPAFFARTNLERRAFNDCIAETGTDRAVVFTDIDET